MTEPGDQVPDPRRDYSERLLDRSAELEKRSRAELTVSISRLLVFIVTVASAWMSVQAGAFAPAWVALPLGLFLVLLVVHERVLRQRRSAARAVAYFEQGLARLDLAESGSSTVAVGGQDGARYLDPAHLYSSDLDLVGTNSLYQRICRARTRAGEDRLAAWLLDPMARVERPEELVVELESRQQAVRELTTHPDLLEELATAGVQERASIETPDLLEWVLAERRFGSWSGALAALLALLAVANLTTMFGWWLLDWPRAPFLIAALLTVVAHAVLLTRWQAAIDGVERAQKEVDLILGLLGALERREFDSPWLADRVSRLSLRGMLPSAAGRELRQLVSLADSRRNPFFLPLGLLVVFVPQIAVAAERWRERWAEEIVDWFEVLADCEALASLATYSFERPRSPFPELDSGPEPVLRGRDLRHPLIPDSKSVPNGVKLRGVGEPGTAQALVISGSNMSGKSTYLRTCGLNVALALAGGPIDGQHLRLTPLRVAASMRIIDSLSEGSSKFYAEISRLRDILEATESGLPVLFLLDEILHGTNSHDRRIGAEGVLAALLDRGAIGLMTTHDLALAELAESDPDRLRNVHFVDEVRDGAMVFDYRLHDGVVRRSNALDLMRQVGLDV